jgi:hypothetical protein
VHPKRNSHGPSPESAGESRRRFRDARPVGDHVIDISKSRQEHPKLPIYWAEA